MNPAPTLLLDLDLAALDLCSSAVSSRGPAPPLPRITLQRAPPTSVRHRPAWGAGRGDEPSAGSSESVPGKQVVVTLCPHRWQVRVQTSARPSRAWPPHACGHGAVASRAAEGSAFCENGHGLAVPPALGASMVRLRTGFPGPPAQSPLVSAPWRTGGALRGRGTTGTGAGHPLGRPFPVRPSTVRWGE